MSVLKAASERLMRGDIAALDEVKALPGMCVRLSS
jgi:hypothetical protein